MSRSGRQELVGGGGRLHSPGRFLFCRTSHVSSDRFFRPILSDSAPSLIPADSPRPPWSLASAVWRSQKAKIMPQTRRRPSLPLLAVIPRVFSDLREALFVARTSDRLSDEYSGTRTVIVVAERPS